MIDNDKVILTDCDGVCLDWEVAFMHWCQHNGMVPVDDWKLKYKVSERFNVPYEGGKRLTNQFNSSASIGFLPPLRDAQWYIKLLAEKYGYKFVAVTSLHTDPYAQNLRTQNLKKLFGEDTFIEYHYLGCGDDKDEILEELSHKYSGAPWIEDKPVNAQCGANFGFESYLIEHGHNMTAKGDYTVVKTWEELTYWLVHRTEASKIPMGIRYED